MECEASFDPEAAVPYPAAVNPKNLEHLPESLRPLRELSSNLWWTWHPAARGLFERLDPTRWRRSGPNPVSLLGHTDTDILHRAASDPVFLERLARVAAAFRAEMEAPSAPGIPQDRPVAYFCAEFGLHTSVPIYSGGLGVLAGDHCRQASDRHLPMVGVGLLYQKGYFRQHLGPEGAQYADADSFVPEDLPLTPVVDPAGERTIATLPVDGREIRIGAWRVLVGRVPVYLLDTDLEGNSEPDRHLTSTLYAGDSGLRIRQEAVLGIGGVRVLRALGITPSVWHMNEGHTALQILERCREQMEDGHAFHEALESVQSVTVFTTHTPVAAGHDHFPQNMVEEVLGEWFRRSGLDQAAVFDVAAHPSDARGDLNMTVLAMRGSRRINGVSKRHGEVARRMWQVLWPDLPEDDVPITAITNGVHVPLWRVPEMTAALSAAGGDPERLTDEALWTVHGLRKRRLLALVRERIRRSWRGGESLAAQIVAAGSLLDPETLTLGFARRFATYKRPTLLFHDFDRLRRLLNDPRRPIQVIFAGKAHPRDEAGQQLVRDVYARAMDPETAGRIAFVEDYDMRLAAHLVSGVDVWLNNPLPPLEASGTSGIKAALNGVPQCSTLDGWWLEAYDGSNGWAIGEPLEMEGFDPHSHELPAGRDASDAASLYDLLEERIIPAYYERDRDGIPGAWTLVMREAIRTALERFGAGRMLDEYINGCYLPAVEGGKEV